MEITKDRIYEDYKNLVSGRKYWLVFLIMTPVFLFIGAMGGSIGIGIFMSALMLIYMICSTISTNNVLKRLKKGDFVIFYDVIVDKTKIRRTRKSSSNFYVSSQKLFKARKEVIPTLYNNVEVNHPFAAIYTGTKLIYLYDLATNVLNSELNSKLREVA